MKRPSASREECLASLFLRHLWREVLHLRVPPRSRLTHSGLLRDPGDQALCSCTSLVYLKSCPRRSFPSAPFCRYRSSDILEHPGDGRRTHAQTRKIFVMKAVAFRRSGTQLRGYQIQGVSVLRGRPCKSPTSALETLPLSWWHLLAASSLTALSASTSRHMGPAPTTVSSAHSPRRDLSSACFGLSFTLCKISILPLILGPLLRRRRHTLPSGPDSGSSRAMAWTCL